jgi:hypothetical protein
MRQENGKDKRLPFNSILKKTPLVSQDNYGLPPLNKKPSCAITIDLTSVCIDILSNFFILSEKKK